MSYMNTNSPLPYLGILTYTYRCKYAKEGDLLDQHDQVYKVSREGEKSIGKLMCGGITQRLLCHIASNTVFDGFEQFCISNHASD